MWFKKKNFNYSNIGYDYDIMKDKIKLLKEFEKKEGLSKTQKNQLKEMEKEVLEEEKKYEEISQLSPKEKIKKEKEEKFKKLKEEKEFKKPKKETEAVEDLPRFEKRVCKLCGEEFEFFFSWEKEIEKFEKGKVHWGMSSKVRELCPNCINQKNRKQEIIEIVTDLIKNEITKLNIPSRGIPNMDKIKSKLLIKQKGKCAICKQELDEDFHIDHIFPYSKKFGYSDGFENINNINNLQILCKNCNWNKGTK